VERNGVRVRGGAGEDGPELRECARGVAGGGKSPGVVDAWIVLGRRHRWRCPPARA
jgi:hypothetical protein